MKLERWQRKLISPTTIAHSQPTKLLDYIYIINVWTQL